MEMPCDSCHNLFISKDDINKCESCDAIVCTKCTVKNEVFKRCKECQQAVNDFFELMIN